ncbi:hypothetical protein EYF80_013672 [Liparis tanakae]|uniref:Uncharacterized protein n=1 Tax=Liparis tanakae TaxID=230148 RepID=A0A4Z2IEF0_9TELE|nr:hypothetical protein EYF80_013672 [Liparis tanakae]
MVVVVVVVLSLRVKSSKREMCTETAFMKAGPPCGGINISVFTEIEVLYTFSTIVKTENSRITICYTGSSSQGSGSTRRCPASPSVKRPEPVAQELVGLMPEAARHPSAEPTVTHPGEPLPRPIAIPTSPPPQLPGCHHDVSQWTCSQQHLMKTSWKLWVASDRWD